MSRHGRRVGGLSAPGVFMRRSSLAVGLLVSLIFTSVAAAQDEPIIKYDDHHVPYIEGTGSTDDKKDESAMFGLGYSQMRDFPVNTLVNLWQFTGNSGKLLGAPGLGPDKVARLWQMPQFAHEIWLALDADTTTHSSGTGSGHKIANMIRAYVDGLNQGRAWWRAHQDAINQLVNNNHRAALDIHFGYISDSAELLTHAFSDNSAPDDMAITPEHVIALGLSFPIPPPKFKASSGPSASNCWLIPPGITGSGNIIRMQGDPHTGFDESLFRKYFLQIKGGKYQASGFTIPGYPCIIEGYSSKVGWVGAAAPANSRAITRWFIKVIRDSQTNERGFNYNNGTNTSFVALDMDYVELDYWVPTSGSVAAHLDTEYEALWYVPREGVTTISNPWDRFPIIEDAGEEGGGPIWITDNNTTVTESSDECSAVFGRYSALDSPSNIHSIIEFYLRVGMAGDVYKVSEVVDDNVYHANLQYLFGDTAGGRFFSYITKIPNQSSAALSSPGTGLLEWYKAPAMPGNNIAYRWNSSSPFLSYSSVPQRGPNAASIDNIPWIGCNSSPEYILNESTLTFSDLVSTKTLSWRTQMARELINAASPVSSVDNETISVNKTNPWAKLMWKDYILPFVHPSLDSSLASVTTLPTFLSSETEFIDAVAGKYYYPSSTNPTFPLDLATQDATNLGLVPEDADPRSATMPWMTLLRGLYEDNIAELTNAQIGSNAAALYITKGAGYFNLSLDPESYFGTHAQESSALPSIATFATDSKYTIPRAALESAIRQAAELYALRSKSLNPILPMLTLVTPLPSDSDTDEPFGQYNSSSSTNLDNYYYYTPTGSGTFPSVPDDFNNIDNHPIRWGHCNQMVLNPGVTVFPTAILGYYAPLSEYLLPGYAGWYTQEADLNFDSAVDGSTSKLFDHTFLITYISTVLNGVSSVFPSEGTPLSVYPLGGCRDSLFVTANKYTPSEAGSVRIWRDSNDAVDSFLYWIPLTAGSESTLTIDIPLSGAPSGRYLQARGATEFTKDIVLSSVVIGSAADRYATSDDFVNGIFRDLNPSSTSNGASFTGDTEFTYSAP